MSFYTEVIQKDPRFLWTVRVSDMGLLEPNFRQTIISIIEDAGKQQISFIPFETYRSQARQSILFSQGATKLKTVGVHHYGLACDLVRMVGGEPSWKADYSLLGDLAKKYGLIWGGDWGNPDIAHSFVDAVHVQGVTLEQQAALFAGTWYPDYEH